MAIAASLSLPPGAMFSLMFTKHTILNFFRRQEESSALQSGRFSFGREALRIGRYVNNTAIFDNYSTIQRRSRQICATHRAAAADAIGVGAAGPEDLVHVY